MPTFYLVRHGQKDENVPRPPLTPLGHEQAIKTGLYLKQFPITRIIASPLLRTQQTAQHIADALKLPVETDDRLRERVEWYLDTVSEKEFSEEWKKTAVDRDFVPRWGNSSRKTGELVEQATQEAGFGKNDHIVFVTSGGTIGDFLKNVFTEQQLSKLERKSPQEPDYRIHECSVTQVKLENGKYTLLDLHHTMHL